MSSHRITRRKMLAGLAPVLGAGAAAHSLIPHGHGAATAQATASGAHRGEASPGQSRPGRWPRRRPRVFSPVSAGGMAAGVAILYVTGLLVSA